MSARERTGDPAGAVPEPSTPLDAERRAILVTLADHLIPAAHGMPSAAEVVTDRRLRFVVEARPDLLEPLLVATRPGLPVDAPGRLAALERENPAALDALLLAVVGAYYTDRDVRDRLGYPGQEAKTLRSWEIPAYVEEGLIERVLTRGPVWRDPATGRRADAASQTLPDWLAEPGGSR